MKTKDELTNIFSKTQQQIVLFWSHKAYCTSLRNQMKRNEICTLQNYKSVLCKADQQQCDSTFVLRNCHTTHLALTFILPVTTQLLVPCKMLNKMYTRCLEAIHGKHAVKSCFLFQVSVFETLRECEIFKSVVRISTSAPKRI